MKLYRATAKRAKPINVFDPTKHDTFKPKGLYPAPNVYVAPKSKRYVKRIKSYTLKGEQMKTTYFSNLLNNGEVYSSEFGYGIVVDINGVKDDRVITAKFGNKVFRYNNDGVKEGEKEQTLFYNEAECFLLS